MVNLAYFQPHWENDKAILGCTEPKKYFQYEYL